MQLSPVPPQRQAALIIPQDRPVYRITAEKGFFGPDDHLYIAGSVIAYDEEPNLDMEPLNARAQATMKDYLKKLDDEGRKVAKMTGKAYNSLADAYENSIVLAQQDAKRVQVVGGAEMTPLMGADKKNKNNISRVEATDGVVPATGSNGKFSLKQRIAKDVVNKTDGAI